MLGVWIHSNEERVGIRKPFIFVFLLVLMASRSTSSKSSGGVRCGFSGHDAIRVCSNCWKCEEHCDCSSKKKRFVNGHIGN